MAQRCLFIFGCLLSVVLIGFGFIRLQSYDSAPGAAARPPASAPVALAAFSRQTRLPVLLMFVHPKCPCTRASLDELALLMAQESGRVSAHVVFALPSADTRQWLPSDLWRQASSIPGVHVVADPDGTLTRRFGSATSGQVLLYSAAGRLLFQGGITSARGHDGDNLGSQTILRLLNGERKAVASTPVFGCPLFATQSNHTKKVSSVCRIAQKHP